MFIIFDLINVIVAIHKNITDSLKFKQGVLVFIIFRYVNGGAIAAIFDSILGFVTGSALACSAVTRNLEVSYKE